MYKNTPINKISINGYKIFQPNSDKLVIEKAWKEQLLPFLLFFAFFVLWYWVILSSTGHNDPNIFTRIYKIITNEPALIIFLIVPLFMFFPILYKLSKKVLNRDKYYIDSKRGTITNNNRLLTSFVDISKISINPQKSELIIKLKDDNKIELIKSKSLVGLKKVAEILSKFIKMPISE